MGTSSQFFSYFGKEALAGGLNTTDHPLIAGPSDMTDVSNITVTQTLGRRKRPGLINYCLASFASTASYLQPGIAIRGHVQYWRYPTGAIESTQDIFLHQGAKLVTIPNRVDPSVERQGSFTPSSSGIPSYQPFEGLLYFVSSEITDGYKKWDGQATVPGNVQIATPPIDGSGKYLSTWQARMIMGGNPDFPYRVYISAALDAESWTGPDSTSLDLTADGDPIGITGFLGELEGRFYIGTRNSIYQLYATDLGDPVTFFVERISRGIGLVSQGSVVATSNDIVFASDRGIHSIRKMITSDQTEINYASRDISSLFTQQLAPNLLTRATAVWDSSQNLYILSVCSSGQLTNDVLLVYNLTFGYWTVWNDVQARSLASVLINFKPTISVGREDGKLAVLDQVLNTDFGAGFSAFFKTAKLFPGGKMHVVWTFKSVTILVSADNVSGLSLTWTIDDTDTSKSGSSQTTLGQSADLLGSTFVLGASRLGIGRFIPVTFDISETGYNIQFQFNQSGNSNVEYYGFILECEEGNMIYAA